MVPTELLDLRDKATRFGWLRYEAAQHCERDNGSGTSEQLTYTRADRAGKRAFVNRRHEPR
jgi:hypothetical protein